VNPIEPGTHCCSGDASAAINIAEFGPSAVVATASLPVPSAPVLTEDDEQRDTDLPKYGRARRAHRQAAMAGPRCWTTWACAGRSCSIRHRAG
jgi:hypothetical protein